MPINPNALPPSPEPDEQSDPQTPGTGEEIAQEVQTKRTRRSKAQMIADAPTFAEDELVEIKDLFTGTKIQRPWAEARGLLESKKAEFVDKDNKYALDKWKQQQAAPAFQETPPQQTPMDAPGTVETTGQTAVPATDAFGRPSPEQLQAAQLPTDVSGQMLAPDGSEHGDEVVVGSKTYFVGPGGTLVDGVVDATAKRRWQRQLGTGENGPWESKDIVHSGSLDKAPAQSNGHSDQPPITIQTEPPVTVQTEPLPHEAERVDLLTWKISTGLLEKIGLPQGEKFAGGSQLQVGPISVTRYAIDDGRRTTVTLNDGREAQVPSAIVEAFEVADNTVEFIASRFRGQMQAFLAATGALRQPVS